MNSIPERSEIDSEYKWNLDSIYERDEKWKKNYQEVKERLDELRSYKKDITDNGNTLLSVLKLREEIMREVSKINAYARMRSDEDTRNQKYQAMASRARALSSEANSAGSYIEPAIQSLSEKEIKKMIKSTEGLEVYEHYLENIIRMKPHTRSPEIEEILSDLGEILGAPNDIYKMLTNADMTFPEITKPDGDSIPITYSNFTKLLKFQDREFREKVHRSFYKEMGEVRNTIGSSLRNAVRSHIKTANIREYKNSRHAAMNPPNIPTEIYDTLLETINSNLGVLDKHIKLKKKHLNLNEIKMWDIYVPITQDNEPKIEYEKAKEYITRAVDPLGEKYKSKVKEGFKSNWIDVYENKGKRSGAYSGGTYDTQPFILINYQKDISSMYTLAHEIGHSLHSEFTSESQPYIYSDYKIFVAEVASTVNEILLTHYLIENIDDKNFKKHIINQHLERFRSTLYRQTMFADFEDKIHKMEEKGKALTPDKLDEIYIDLKSNFYQSAKLDDLIKREWMRIPHFYYNYYVYQYSTGISAAVSIVRDIIKNGKPAKERYLDFLTLGSSKYPIELLKETGIDMTTSQPIEEAIDMYREYLRKYSNISDR